jgi:hypothetical protein
MGARNRDEGAEFRSLKTASLTTKTQRAQRNSNAYEDKDSNQIDERLRQGNWLILLCVLCVFVVQMLF